MKKRARNGSIRPSGPRWQAQYKAPGETTYRAAPHTFPTWDEAQRWLDDTATDMRRGTWQDTSKAAMTFAALAADVFEIRQDWKPGTRRNNTTLLNGMLLPTFGHMKLSDITLRTVEVWWARKAAHPVNRRNAYFLLSGIMKKAVVWKYIPASPCVIEKAGKDVSKRRPDHTPEEFVRVVDELPDYCKTPALVLFSSSARISELAGLNYGDYDGKTGSLTIQRQLSEIGGMHLAPTKTDTAEPVILFKWGRDALDQYLKTNPGFPGIAMFRGTRGARLSARRFRIEWARACETAGIENFNPHDCRHTSLTVAAQAGLTAAEIMKRGRHTTQASSSRYLHAIKEREQELVSRINDLLEGTA